MNTTQSIEVPIGQVTVAVESALDVVSASFYGVLGMWKPYTTASGIEPFVGCHALNCYS